MKKNFDLMKNALDPKADSKEAVMGRALFYPTVFVAIFFAVFSFQVLFSGDGVDHTRNNGGTFSFINSIINSGDKKLRGEEDDRINILLTGMGGLGHSGPFLTDTIIFASIQPSTNKVSLLSIPRDLSVSIPGHGWRRINSVNHYGELQEERYGAEYTSEYISHLLNQPIHYYVRIDFAGFEKVINDLGGIDVYVEKAFTDSQFPDDSFGYQTISFQQGWNEMDGATALNYARSRHGSNGEASDFARSQRQQKVIKAIKDEVLSASTFFSIKKISDLYETYQQHVTTNMEAWEMMRFAKMAKSINNENIANVVLDNEENGLLYSTLVNGAYLLMPRDESFFE
ncbi:LCP family protein, partial [Candidatus Falkowbacteria bacterium]|nr:LCP family protein [Candidatus Falkowbacteria bacterium]